MLLTLFYNRDFNLLSGNEHRLNRICQIVYIEHRNTLHRRDLIEIEVVGQDLASGLLRQLEKLKIDLGRIFVILIRYFHGNAQLPLHLRYYIQAASAFGTLERIGAVRDMLKLPEHKLRHNHSAFYYSRFQHVYYSAVYYHRRIQYLRPEKLVALLFPLCRSRLAPERGFLHSCTQIHYYTRVFRADAYPQEAAGEVHYNRQRQRYKL